MMNEPKFHRGQMVRNLHSWAKDHPERPVEDVMWDESWGCYTYSYPLSLIRIEEHMLEPTGEPDIDPKAWEKKWRIEQIENAKGEA